MRVSGCFWILLLVLALSAARAEESVPSANPKPAQTQGTVTGTGTAAAPKAPTQQKKTAQGNKKSALLVDEPEPPCGEE